MEILKACWAKEHRSVSTRWSVRPAWVSACSRYGQHVQCRIIRCRIRRPEPAKALAVIGGHHRIKEQTMLKWALIFLVISLVSGFMGFSGVSAATATIARVLFFIAIIVFLVFLLLAFMAGSLVL
jgi:uncharacterized membrane protein YtjA (UPF0391 family)